MIAFGIKNIIPITIKKNGDSNCFSEALVCCAVPLMSAILTMRGMSIAVVM
jgi:hypothetical protein